MGSPWIRARMWVSCIGRQILHHWATREALNCLNSLSSLFILSYLIFAMFDELHRAGVCVCMYYISNFKMKKFIFHTSYNHPGGSDGKESILNVGDLCLIPGLGRSPGEGQGNPLQYSCSENPHWQRSLAGYSPWGRKELDKTEWLSTAHTHTHIITITEENSPKKSRSQEKIFGIFLYIALTLFSYAKFYWIGIIMLIT